MKSFLRPAEERTIFPLLHVGLWHSEARFPLIFPQLLPVKGMKLPRYETFAMKLTRMTILLATLFIATLAGAAYGAVVWYVNDVETVSYKVVASDSEFEIRDYPELLVAETKTTGSRDKAVNAGFRPLATYIFAKEREGQQIAMTAPVTQESGDSGQTWTVRFMMPADYSLDSLPDPKSENVSLLKVPAARRAAIRFSGNVSDQLIADKEGELRTWLQQRGISPAGPATYAYYNAPFSPGFMKRNEVLFEIPEN